MADENKELSETLRALLERRGLTQLEVAESVGLSATAVSRIFRGHAAPRLGNFNRIVRKLARTPDERTALMRAFSGQPANLADELSDDAPSAVSEEPATFGSRVERYSEAKSFAIDFRRDIKAALRQSGIRFQDDFTSDNLEHRVACDFLLGGRKNRVVMDAKTNLTEDWERSLGAAKLLMRALDAERAVIAIPYFNRVAAGARDYYREEGVDVVAFADLVKFLRELGL